MSTTGSMVKDIELAILFADVVGSTRLFETLGDQRARAMVAICIDVMRTATEEHNGTVIKTIGDEVMATFPKADDALDAAGQMQKQIAAHAELKMDGQPVAIRIGCHFGPVVLEARDVFGASVHTANRMTSQAKAGQIITTSATVERLSPEWRASVRQIDVATIRGQGAEVALYEVLWQTEDVTSMLPAIALTARDQRRTLRMRLTVADREVIVDQLHPQVVIGRADESDIIIRGNLISRLHARIEFNRNRFTLTDMSTNGTFVQIAGQEEAFVRRDTIPIKGEGMVGLGKSPDAESPQTLRFACEEA
ncbi:MAG TPA: adenylate/guanylate cyclase domain-containing protein [Burkholderiaceae bacterium]|nr:adenylate/guanylate cyclase domain-containing protein [Burkholderiaceae bacterium]